MKSRVISDGPMRSTYYSADERQPQIVHANCYSTSEIEMKQTVEYNGAVGLSILVSS